MKISEINNPNQLSEGIGQGLSDLSSGLFGQHATSAIKGMFTGAGTKATLAQDIFLKDFYSDALTSLKNGISSGVIDPKLSMAEYDAKSQTDNSVKSATTNASVNSNQKVKNPGDTARPGAAGGGQKSDAEEINQAYGKVVGNMRNVQSGTKPLPSKMITSLNTEINNARYNKDWAINTGNKIINLAKKGYDVSDLKKSWDMSTAIGRKQGTVQENLYQHLNMILEHIIQEQDSGTKSIGDYMLEWFGMYMAGTNWDSYKPKIMQLCKGVEDNYRKGNWKDAIRILGKAAYSIPGSGEAKGAQNAATAASNSEPEQKRQFGAKTTPQTSAKIDPEQLKATLAGMSKSEREKFIKSMQNIK